MIRRPKRCSVALMLYSVPSGSYTAMDERKLFLRRSPRHCLNTVGDKAYKGCTVDSINWIAELLNGWLATRNFSPRFRSQSISAANAPVNEAEAINPVGKLTSAAQQQPPEQSEDIQASPAGSWNQRQSHPEDRMPPKSCRCEVR